MSFLFLIFCNKVNDRASGFLSEIDFGAKIKAGMEKPDFDTKLCAKLTELSMKPEGMLIQTMAGMFGGVPLMVPVLKPMILGLADEFATSLTSNFDISDIMSIDKIRVEIDSLMTEKLQVLTPEKVKALMEEVIKEHLGWLVVWGNVFGGLIGIVSQAFGFGA